MDVLRVAALVLGALVVLGLLLVAIGYALPVKHVAVREAMLPAPPERVYAAIGNVEQYAAWRSDLQAVEVLASPPALRWRERGGNGTITYELADTDPPRRLVTRIADPSLPFGGSWTYQLTPSGTGTTLVITEHGEVYNPLFRLMSRFVFGHTRTMEKYLEDLEIHLRQ